MKTAVLNQPAVQDCFRAHSRISSEDMKGDLVARHTAPTGDAWDAEMRAGLPARIDISH